MNINAFHLERIEDFRNASSQLEQGLTVLDSQRINAAITAASELRAANESLDALQGIEILSSLEASTLARVVSSIRKNADELDKFARDLLRGLDAARNAGQTLASLALDLHQSSGSAAE